MNPRAVLASSEGSSDESRAFRFETAKTTVLSPAHRPLHSAFLPIFAFLQRFFHNALICRDDKLVRSYAYSPGAPAAAVLGIDPEVLICVPDVTL